MGDNTIPTEASVRLAATVIWTEMVIEANKGGLDLPKSAPADLSRYIIGLARDLLEKK